MNNLATLLANVNGATFIAISTKTAPKLKGGKRNPFQNRVHKLMAGANVMVFQNKKSNGYKNMVHRRLEREGKDSDSFTLSPRAWGSRVPNTPFIEHNGKYYLEVIFLRPGKVVYTVDGVPQPKELIQGLTTSPEGNQGGLEDKVIIRTFSVSNITHISIDHKMYDNLYFEMNTI